MATKGQIFQKSLANWSKKAGNKLEALARQSIQEMAQRVVTTTPVHTGFLRGSWQPSIGTVDLGAPGSSDKTGARAQVKTGLVVKQMKPGDTFFLINNAAYAMRVEYGFVGEDSLGRSYNQKGRFFVTRAVKQWPQIVAKTAAELKIT
jgi:hypothetical protein